MFIAHSIPHCQKAKAKAHQKAECFHAPMQLSVCKEQTEYGFHGSSLPQACALQTVRQVSSQHRPVASQLPVLNCASQFNPSLLTNPPTLHSNRATAGSPETASPAHCSTAATCSHWPGYPGSQLCAGSVAGLPLHSSTPWPPSGNSPQAAVAAVQQCIWVVCAGTSQQFCRWVYW